MVIQDVLTIGFLVIMEGLLSFDNAIVLAGMVKHLPKTQQKKALTYGIFGAFGFRFLALTVITYLLKAFWMKFIGGAYLIWLAMNHFFGTDDQEKNQDQKILSRKFWKMVIYVELADIV